MATRAKKTVKAKSSKKAAKKAVKTAAKKAAKARASKAAKKTRKSDASKRVTKSAAKTTSKAGKKAGKKQVVAKKTVKKAAKKPTKAPAKSVARKAKVTAPAAIAVPAPAAAPPKVAKPQPKPKAPRAPKPAAAPQVATQVKAPARGNVFYITTAIAYPNGSPHIGHAYEAIATDVLARFARLDGKDVFFLTGTDEHGLKMVQTAQNEGLTPSALATRNANRFREMDERLNVSFDRFIRTTEEQHHRSSQEIWRRMEANGDIYSDTYSGWYSVRDEAYYAEEETRLNDDGVRLGPQGTPVEWVEEKSYFFRLSAYQDKLLKLYETQPDFIGPDSRKNEVVSFVRGGLRDLSISRTTFDWGVKVPGDEEHVMYVWVDALTNYITGVGFPDESDKNWRYWPADVHIIGKDIIRFHAVYWPAFLMSAGIPVQKRVYAHGFLFNRGEKMSKSVGNVVDPFNLADQYGVDQMRYFFLREVPFGQDGNYNHEAIVARINADLANDLGNLAQRSLSMIAKQLGGVLPEPGEFSDNDKAILAMADGMIAASREAMATQQIHHWLGTVWAVVAEANRYFAGEAPWALAKTDPVRQKTVLYVTAEVVRQIAILAQPAMPTASGLLLDSLGIPAGERNFATLGGARRIAPGSTLPAPTPAFPRYIEPAA
ncbi:methionine--tRNA ligase [Bradyrhizobium diazoefficiens]|nr:methionine--tRNA ligase [Bradyrhizobium diazoefficiens]MBR0965365.1 methionine--tRNA ligase [Bradyrhizobium diazoefficiens]MBR0980812.1 methionine--tRNA ligase [Bradyrhizobium diazoefficiens]MBR1010606.1 methionine--tRNA ligase [Bradyrhizobium diazoefficiens]MBR1016945.1 methionine--tRNA ligase [Bradyrhizobium diazoefficiens]MBR1054352.1 methionine--tRNA ligase [Bradyrhizobium diazoefficiens]